MVIDMKTVASVVACIIIIAVFCMSFKISSKKKDSGSETKKTETKADK